MRICGFIFLICVLCPAHALEPYPLEKIVAEAKENCANASFEPTELSRQDYLRVIEGIVGFFRKHQNEQGRIIDPYQKKEVQYSTPCYAWAAAALIESGRQTNLLDSAALALDAALQELAEAKAADNHGDFFTFPAMLAFEHLRERVPGSRRAHWEELIRKIDPYRAYRDTRDPHNWNVVALSGEFLRQKNGFTDGAFVEKFLEQQFRWFTLNGQYRDPNVPMAYDHFPRHFLAAILERGYEGSHRARLEELLERAAWTSLLIQSPNGELPVGGRSAQHQWNEAQQCVTYEIWARRKLREGKTTEAGMFKRAAHLSLQSIQRWIRPGGELWIVKNRLDPAKRHGFETYSSHSQYNLLAASMLASAWLFADDVIPERAAPSEVGGFVFELPEFHKIFANAGGLYLEFDTAADPHYDSTGLIRIHKKALEPLLGPSAGSAAEKGALAVGPAWPVNDTWESLAACGSNRLSSVKLKVDDETPKRVRFEVSYTLRGAGAKAVTESYELTPERIQATASVDTEASHIRLEFPFLTSDGERSTRIQLDGETAKVSFGSQAQRITIRRPSGTAWRQRSEPIPNRNGFVDALEADVTGRSVTYEIVPRN